MTSPKTRVNCPTCQKSVIWSTSNKYRPFCSEHCKLVDLGEWAAEEKRIPGEEIPMTANDQEGFGSDSY